MLALGTPLPFVIAAALVSGIGSMAFTTLWETTLQESVPVRARARVSSYDWFGSLALQPLGYALIGPLASATGAPAALYLCSALELSAMAALLAVRDVRGLTPPPRNLGFDAAACHDHRDGGQILRRRRIPA
jgi:MFS family permease